MEDVTRARLLAERMFYFSQKLSTIVGWRVDLHLAITATNPEVVRAMENIDEVVKNSTRFAVVAESIPATLDAQRAALIGATQEMVTNEVGRIAVVLSNERAALFRGIAGERAALLDAIQQGKGDAHAVLVELRTTIEAAEKLSASVGTVVGRINEMTGGNSGPSNSASTIRCGGATVQHRRVSAHHRLSDPYGERAQHHR